VSLADPADAPTLVRDRRTAVLDALRELPGRQREVLVLRHYLELSEEEIAETLGISRGSVKSHASRGSAALRRLLEGQLHDGGL
jgi:RNA polymerase sigma factor (sigma-70 family)